MLSDDSYGRKWWPMGVWYSLSRKLKPYGMFRSCIAPPMFTKNHATSTTARKADTICVAHWMIRA